MDPISGQKWPLSPFMIGPYYRPQITSISSIMVRLTGIASLGSAFLVVWWLLAAATSESAFGLIDGLLRSWFGDLILLLASWAIWYHMLGRLRQIVWDFSHAAILVDSVKMGWGMFIAATGLALFTAIVL